MSYIYEKYKKKYVTDIFHYEISFFAKNFLLAKTVKKKIRKMLSCSDIEKKRREREREREKTHTNMECNGYNKNTKNEFLKISGNLKPFQIGVPKKKKKTATYC